MITGCKDCEANNNNKQRNVKIMSKKINIYHMLYGWSVEFDPVRCWCTKYVYMNIKTNLDGEHGVFAITLFVNNKRSEWHHLVHTMTGKVFVNKKIVLTSTKNQQHTVYDWTVEQNKWQCCHIWHCFMTRVLLCFIGLGHKFNKRSTKHNYINTRTPKNRELWRKKMKPKQTNK